MWIILFYTIAMNLTYNGDQEKQYTEGSMEHTLEQAVSSIGGISALWYCKC